MLRAILAGIFIVTALTGCKSNNPIIGKWECTRGKDKLSLTEFTETEVVSGKERSHFPAEYEVKKDLVVVYVTAFGTRQGQEYSFKNDDLIETKSFLGTDVCKRSK